MKTIFTVLSGLFMSLDALAIPVDFHFMSQSALTVRSQGQADIRVVINGRRFDADHNTVTIYNLRPGAHSIKIYRKKTARMFDFFGKRYELVYNSNLVVRPRTNVLIHIDRWGYSTVSQKPLKRRGYGWEWDRGVGRDRYNDRMQDRDIIAYETDDEFGPQAFDYDRSRRPDEFDSDEWENDSYDIRPMGDHEFATVLQSIRQEWFEGNKVKSAQQVIASNYLTSLQVKQLLQLFTFENNKLDLAKQAYGKTIDQRMYLATVGGVFTFSSSKDELARYIRNY